MTIIRGTDSPIEAHFARDARAMKLPRWEREYVPFSDRKFRLDFAWPELAAYVEIDGMVHRIKERFDADREKSTLLVLAGWTGIHVTGAHVRDGRAIAWAKQLIEQISFLRAHPRADRPPLRLAQGAAERHQTTLITASEIAYGTHE